LEIKNRYMSVHQRGLLMLLTLLLGAWALHGLVSFQRERGAIVNVNQLYVLITGEVRDAGVYGFNREPGLSELLNRAGGLLAGLVSEEPKAFPELAQGTSVHISMENGHLRISPGSLPAYYKVTLGIPLSLNTASETELQAVPYIGPSLARKIIDHRSRNGPFTAVEQIKSLPGVGNVRYVQIKPYITIWNSKGRDAV
jgi:competence protein ComEA